ncbi:MAG: ArgE/DapE family deacylase [Pyrinomonadaceae bacterium]|nr:ArgE/DapE family deacylase [Pyrinomonadaceae bacterium]
MSDPTIKLLRKLVAINSVNPSLVPGGAGEKEIASAVAGEMRAIGMDVEVTEVAPGRPNVVGVLEGSAQGKSLMFCGHIDTVGVEGMSSPFDPIERDGRLYGRGAGDMKGGVAAMIEAARSLANSGAMKAGRLIVAAVVDEEYASIGAESLIKNWHADAAIVTEPTDLVVSIGHKGFSWVEITTEGRAAHGSRPLEGRDAILRMGRVLSHLEKLDRELQSRTPHPVLGTPSLHGSLIEGGRELSTYPDRCVLKMERRTIIGEPGEIALDEAEEILAALSQEDSEFKGSAHLMFSRAPYETPAGHDLPQMLESALSYTGRGTTRAGMTYWTDAAILGQVGIPSVIFGPGGAGYHGLEEYVRVEDVLVCRDALAKLASDFCT